MGVTTGNHTGLLGEMEGEAGSLKTTTPQALPRVQGFGTPAGLRKAGHFYVRKRI